MTEVSVGIRLPGAGCVTRNCCGFLGRWRRRSGWRRCGCGVLGPCPRTQEHKAKDNAADDAYGRDKPKNWKIGLHLNTHHCRSWRLAGVWRSE